MNARLPLSLGMLCACASTAHADLLDVLRDNGTIDQSQYEQLKSEHSPSPQYVKASDLNIKFVGRFYADFAHFQEDITPIASGAELRTARLEAKGSYKDHWKFKTQYGLNDDQVSTRYVWLGYQFDSSILKVGRTVESIGISDYSSSRYITFMERAMPVTAFGGNFAQGVEYNWWNDNSGLQVSALLDQGKPSTSSVVQSSQDENGDGLITTADTTTVNTPVSSADEKFKLSARYSVAAINQDQYKLHLGLWANYLSPPSKTHAISTRPEAHLSSKFLRASFNNVDDVTTAGLELAWINGPWSVQAEVLQRDIGLQNSADATVGGSYIQSSYFLTGHSRNYDAGSGTVGRTQLNGKQAVQLALRYSTMDLNDGTVATGGEGSNITAGINWWPRKNIKFAFNQIFASIEDRPGLANEDIGITQVRAQIDF